MEAEGAAAINERFWRLMGKLWQDNPHERHTASDKLRDYTAEHKIHVNDVSQTVSTKNKPDWQLRSEAASLRRTVETLEAEIRELKRARDPEDLKAPDAAELRRAQAEAAEAQSALAQKRQARRVADAALYEAEARLTRLKTQLEQSEELTLDLRRQLQTLNAHAQTLRGDLTDANELQEELERALKVATATAIGRQRELLEVKQQHRGPKEPPVSSTRLHETEGNTRRASDVLAGATATWSGLVFQCPLFGPRRRRRVEYR